MKFVSSVPGIAAKNRLLAALPLEEYERFLPNLETVSLPLKYVLYEPNKPIEHVYFPIHGVVSLVTIMEDGVAVEIATVGNEGMIGLPVFLGSEIIPMKAFSQIPGKGMRIKADVLKTEFNRGG